MTTDTTTHARVCIIGGGAMGVGLLYHLAEEGWGPECVLVEKGELTSGSTWHAAGQCPHFAGSLNLAKIHLYGTQLYPKLESLTGQPVSWHGCGGVRLALTNEEVDWFHHVKGIGRIIGFESEVVGPDEIREFHPYLETFGVKAGFITFDDGHVAPADSTNAMAKGARDKGAKIMRRCRVTDVSRLPSGEWAVTTENGRIVCEHVVNAAGSYADVVGAWSGHRVPIVNMLHHYLISEALPQLVEREQELPVVRDPYSSCYLREETNGILIGPYETAESHACFRPEDGGLSWDFENELVAPELDRLLPWLEKATERMPLFGEAGLKSVIAGAITHTPDGMFLAGPAPGPANYWMAAGSAIGIAQGAGAGKYLAEWMVHGDSEINMAEFDPRRYGDWADDRYLHTMAVVEYEAMYECLPPGKQHTEGRGLRTSAAYDRLAEHGAQFAHVFGWERPRWFADGEGAGSDVEQYSYRRNNAFDAVAAECEAVRERVGMTDLSTFAKFEVSGAGATAFLDRVLANRLPKREDGTVLTHALSDNGRIRAEFTVTRIAPDRYYLLSGAATELHDFDLLTKAAAGMADVEVVNVSDDYGALVLAGPHSRDVLAALTHADVSNEGFPWLRARTLTVAGIEGVRVLRVSYVGELGYELHAPMAQVGELFDALHAAGEPHGMALYGAYAMNAMRIEKGYPAMGTELTNEINLVDAGLGRFAPTKDRDFIGMARTVAAKKSGPTIALVLLGVDVTDADCHGNEPVYVGDECVGLTTSGAYGHRVGRSLAFAYVAPAHTAPGTRCEVDLYGTRCTAEVLDCGPYDPENARQKA